jgi:hypothetical protein
MIVRNETGTGQVQDFTVRGKSVMNSNSIVCSKAIFLDYFKYMVV